MAKKWGAMTITQMLFLMQAANRTHFHLDPGWGELADKLTDDEVYNSQTHSAAATFFFCVALAGGDCSPEEKTQIRFLRSQYIPNLIREEDDIQAGPDQGQAGSGRFWIRLLINNAYLDDVGPTRYLEEMLQKLTAAGITRSSKLAQLYDTLTGLPCWQDGMNAAFTAFRDYLDQWNGTLLNMWIAIPRESRPLPLVRRPGGLAGEICTLVERGVKQIILTGAPGTGKTRAAREAASYFASLGGMTGEEACALVPFHPSYDYTDFVEGLRPIQNGPNGHVFVRLDGTFKAFCREVAETNRLSTGTLNDADSPAGIDDPNRRYLFLIDEINRADLSKVFGELMFCLEADKRGIQVDTQYRNLNTCDPTGKVIAPENDVFADGFFVPKNVYIIGTMNDIDRSVESMDFALRRRFTWLEVEVTQALLEDAFRSGSFSSILEDNASQAAAQIMALNRVIAVPERKAGQDRPRSGSPSLGERCGLTRQYYIAQGQFTNLPDPLPEEYQDGLTGLMRFVWDYRLAYLLREYVRGEKDSNVADFLEQCKTALLAPQAANEDSPS